MSKELAEILSVPVVTLHSVFNVYGLPKSSDNRYTFIVEELPMNFSAINIGDIFSVGGKSTNVSEFIKMTDNYSINTNTVTKKYNGLLFVNNNEADYFSIQNGSLVYSFQSDHRTVSATHTHWFKLIPL